MRALNYRHLLYFWTVVREGTIAQACTRLHLTQPTISGQLRSLERNLGTRLFERAGRHLVLTDTGRLVYRYADDIFALGRELRHSLADQPAGHSRRLTVGVADTVPTDLVYSLLEPALHLKEWVHLICEQGKPDYLLSQLAVNALDVVLADAPLGPGARVRAFSHLLGECGVSLFAAAGLAANLRRNFPRSLDGAPFLLPAENTVLRQSLERWFDAEGIHPHIRGEFADPALIKVFGQKTAGVFAVRDVVTAVTRRRYQVHLVGRAEPIRERFYAISVDRKLKNPAVVAIMEAARGKLFA